MWRVSREGSVVQLPVKISSLIPQLNATVDAAVSIRDDLWLFSGTSPVSLSKYCTGRNVYVLAVGGVFLQLKHAPLQLTDIGLPSNMDNVRLAYSWHYFRYRFLNI